MLHLTFSSGLAAQDELARRVAEVKGQDPLRQVTFVVESNHHALQFRRQLVRSLLRGAHPASLVAFSAFTKLDVITTLARIAQVAWDPHVYKVAKQEKLRGVLRAHSEVLGNLALHPESFATLTKYTDQFDWVELTDEVVHDLLISG